MIESLHMSKASGSISSGTVSAINDLAFAIGPLSLVDRDIIPEQDMEAQR